MTVATHKENGTLTVMPDEKGLECTTSKDTVSEIEALLDENSWSVNPTDSFNVDVVQVADSVFRKSHSDDPDATDYSSSFGDTASKSMDASELSDGEVESDFCGNNALPSILDNGNNIFRTRRNKLTNHWRKYIRPLMWRCKWAELRMRELETQAEKYGREMEANDKTSILNPDPYASDLCSKLLPFARHGVKRKPMKRRKRNPVEENVDMTTFMSHHHLFSYLESKKTVPDAISSVDDIAVADSFSKHDEFANDQWFKEDQDLLEHVLSKIETIQYQVQGLRTHLNSVILKNGVNFSSSENLSLLAPYDVQTSSAYSPAVSAGNGDEFSIGGAIYTSQDFPDFEIEDLVLPEAVVSNYGIPAEIPDIIESTAGLLSAADVTVRQPNLAEFGENNLDDALLQNLHEARDDQLFGRILEEPLDMILHLENGKHDSSFVPFSELIPDPKEDKAPPPERSVFDSCFPSDVPFPRFKRKRGDRKPSSRGWKARSSAEPDI